MNRHPAHATLLTLLALLLTPVPALAWEFRHVGVDSSGPDRGQYCSLVIGANGRLHASYHRYDSDDTGSRNLIYATKPSAASGSWSHVTVDGSPSCGSYSSIALEKNGNPHIAYYESESADLRHAWYDSSLAMWRTETVDAIGTVGQFCSIVIHPVTGAINIFYFDASKPGLKWAHKPAAGLWSFDYVDTNGVSGLFASAIYWGGYEVAYYDQQVGSLRYAKQNGSGWTVQSVDTPGDVGWNASLAVTKNNGRAIAYYDVTNQRLKYAELSGTTWTTIPVDQAGNSGVGLSLSVGPAGRPAISYYAQGNQDLRYAERFNGTWLFDTIATGGNVGRFSALVVDSNDLPELLWYDETQGKLRSSFGRGGKTGVPEIPVPAPPPPVRPTLVAVANPFRDSCPLRADLPAAARGSLAVFDIRGARVRSVPDLVLPAGETRLAWDGCDDRGQPVTSGLYFVRLDLPQGPAVARVTRVR